MTAHIANELQKGRYDTLLILSGSNRQTIGSDLIMMKEGVGPYFLHLYQYYLFLKETFPNINVVFEPITKPDIETESWQPGDNDKYIRKIWSSFESLIKDKNLRERHILFGNLYDVLTQRKVLNEELFKSEEIALLINATHHFDETKFSLLYMLTCYLLKKYPSSNITLHHADDMKDQICKMLAKTLKEFEYLFPTRITFGIYHYEKSEIKCIDQIQNQGKHPYPFIGTAEHDFGYDVREMAKLCEEHLHTRGLTLSKAYDAALQLDFEKFKQAIAKHYNDQVQATAPTTPEEERTGEVPDYLLINKPVTDQVGDEMFEVSLDGTFINTEVLTSSSSWKWLSLDTVDTLKQAAGKFCLEGLKFFAPKLGQAAEKQKLIDNVLSANEKYENQEINELRQIKKRFEIINHFQSK